MSRDRLQIIMAMPQAKGRDALARHLATATAMSPEQIRACLAAAPSDPLAQVRDVAARAEAYTASAGRPAARGRSGPKVDGTVITEASHPHLCAAYPFLAAAAKATPIVLSADQIRDLEANAGGKGAPAAPARATGGHGAGQDTAADDAFVDRILANYHEMKGHAPKSATRAQEPASPAKPADHSADRPEGMADESEEQDTEGLLARLRAQGSRFVSRR